MYIISIHCHKYVLYLNGGQVLLFDSRHDVTGYDKVLITLSQERPTFSTISHASWMCKLLKIDNKG